jgi:hypothetical protein
MVLETIKESGQRHGVLTRVGLQQENDKPS